MKNKTLAGGFFTLFTAALFNRFLGFFYRIIMVRLVGAEGIGLFQMIMPVFSFILVVTTAGIPPIIAKLVSEKMSQGKIAEAKKMFRLSFLLLALSSTLFTIIGYLTAPVAVQRLFADSRVLLAYLSILPAILLISYSAAFRGYFMGLKDMVPHAVSQVVETMVRFCIGLSAAYFLYLYGLEYAIAGFSIGLVAGEAAGIFVLLLFYYKRGFHKIPSEGNPVHFLKSIFSLSLPVAVNRLVATAALSAQAIIIPQRLLYVGYSMSEATSLYGQLTGIAFALVNLPAIFTVSLAMTMIPAISEVSSVSDLPLLKKRSTLAIKYTLLAGIPWAVIFYLLPGHLTSFLFGCPEAGNILKILSFGCIFIYLQQTSNAILQGLGKTKIMLKNSLIGAAVQIGGIYILTATSMGISGSAMAINVGAASTALLNLFFMLRLTGGIIHFSQIIYFLGSGLIMAGGIKYIKSLLENYTGSFQLLFAACGCGLAVYCAATIAFGLVENKDIKRLPFIDSWSRFSE